MRAELDEAELGEFLRGRARDVQDGLWATYSACWGQFAIGLMDELQRVQDAGVDEGLEWALKKDLADVARCLEAGDEHYGGSR